MAVITVNEFKNKATRVIQITGFEPNEVIEVRVRAANMVGLIASGKLPNALISTINDLFKGQTADEMEEQVMADPQAMAMVLELMDKVCEQCLIEPKYEEVKDYLTDQQKTDIMNAMTFGVQQAIPSVSEQKDSKCNIYF